MITSLRPLVLRAPRAPRDPSPSRVRRDVREQSSTGARPEVHVTHDNLRAVLLFLRSNWRYVVKPVLASAVVPFRVGRGTRYRTRSLVPSDNRAEYRSVASNMSRTPGQLNTEVHPKAWITAESPMRSSSIRYRVRRIERRERLAYSGRRNRQGPGVSRSDRRPVLSEESSRPTRCDWSDTFG